MERTNHANRSEGLHSSGRPGELENLKAIPLFSQCLKSFMKIGIERVIHGVSMAQKIRLGPDQLPEIHAYLPDLPDPGIEEPEIYLEMDPSPNAYTQGDTRIFITLTSGLIEMLEEDELLAVVAMSAGTSPAITCSTTPWRR